MNQYARTTIEWNRQVKIEESKIKKGKEATTKRKSLMKYSEQMNRKKKAFAIEGSENIIHRSLRHETNSNEMGVWVFCIQNQPERRRGWISSLECFAREGV